MDPVVPIDEEEPTPVVPIKPMPYARVLDNVREALCLRTAPGLIIEDQAALKPGMAVIRDADPAAIVTTVKNVGNIAAKVFESGIVVAVIASGETKQLKERGRLEIEAQTTSGGNYFSIITERRALCGDAPNEEPGNPDPIGQFLL